jgi:serine/threonine protein kinase/tetratricopeptide (TPR) repeat protein
MIGQTISHYKILEKLGEGGMGVVYLVQDLKLDRLVALKFLPGRLTADEIEKERFIHEAKAASSLNHPNVTTIHEIDEYEGQLFIVMEYCPGESIKELVEKEELSLKKVLDIGIQICEGLTAAHEKDVVHRDVKSENIMITPETRVKIMDFGLAKLKGTTKITTTGTTVGTVAYMSPEQAQGMSVDRRSDIFSFGVVLYEMITGQLPFKGDHETAVIYSIVNETPEPLARYKTNVSEGLQRIVSKALTKESEERYQHIDDLMADLKHERKLLETGTTDVSTSQIIAAQPRRKRLPLLVSVLAILLVVLFIVIFKSFHVQIGPQREAIAEENSLAIMYFENVADPEDRDRFADMITSLLITDLSESQYMRVVSRQRLYDILRLLGKENLKVIDRSVASEVAARAGVKWILTGTILQMEPHIILTSEVSEASTGKIILSQRVTGEAGEDLFSVVDRLSAKTKKDLALPESAQEELDRGVADVTTHSPEAYRYYIEGVDCLRKVYHTEAEEAFRKALEFDSTFAMVYYRMSSIVDASEQKEMIAKALKYSDKVSWREKHYIKSQEALLSVDYKRAIEELQKIVERYPAEKAAFYWLGVTYWQMGDLELAIDQLTAAVEIDPLYDIIYNMLAYLYHEIGNYERSIWAINQYISIAPDEANPYDSRADLYGYNGKIDQAIESYRMAIEKKRDFYWSWSKLGHMYLFKREYARAESCYQNLTSSQDKDTRSEGRTYLAFIPLYQGKFQEALQHLDHGLAADKMEQVEGLQSANKHFAKAVIFRERNNLNSALAEAQRALEINRKGPPAVQLIWRHYYIQFLAENKDFEKAEEETRSLKRDTEKTDPSQMYRYWFALGSIEFATGNVEASLNEFEKAAREVKYFPVSYALARAYLEAGRLSDAVGELEGMLSKYDENRAYSTFLNAKAHYLLGLAYERSDWRDKAIEQYEEFLEICKDADEGIEEVEIASKRVEALKAKS